MDYPCANFGDFNLSCFGFIVQRDTQTDRITDAANCLKPGFHYPR